MDNNSQKKVNLNLIIQILVLFHQSPCKKSQKGVYLYYQTLQNGADDIIMKRKIISYSLIGRRKEMMRYRFV